MNHRKQDAGSLHYRQLPMIEMSAELANSLNYESKLDRSPQNIHRLIRDGEQQGKAFVDARLATGF